MYIILPRSSESQWRLVFHLLSSDCLRQEKQLIPAKTICSQCKAKTKPWSFGFFFILLACQVGDKCCSLSAGKFHRRAGGSCRVGGGVTQHAGSGTASAGGSARPRGLGRRTRARRRAPWRRCPSPAVRSSLSSSPSSSSSASPSPPRSSSWSTCSARNKTKVWSRSVAQNSFLQWELSFLVLGKCEQAFCG